MTAELLAWVEARLPERMSPTRRDAWKRFSAVGLPSSDEEEWRETPREAFEEIAREGAISSTTRVESGFSLPSAGACFVFASGRFDRALSRPFGVEGSDWSLRQEVVSQTFDGHASPFAALNEAAFDEALEITLRRRGEVPSVITLVFDHEASRGERLQHPRVRMILEGSTAAKVTIIHRGQGRDAWSNARFDATLGQGARLEVRRLCLASEGSGGGVMTDSSEIHLARESVLRWTDVVEGYRAFRGELLVRHLGEGSESILEAISLTDGNDHQAHHWRVEHKVPNTSSRQWWVGLASGKAQSHFAGKVFVEKGASRTDARQHSRGVVLSPGSRVHARPQLEIFNDDVKCAHGSAVGPMDEEALFYLRSRGIDETRARQMILASLVRERSQALTRDLGGLEVWARERIEACLARLSGGAR